MKEKRNVPTNRQKGKGALTSDTLKVLVVGDSETSEECQELLESLATVGYQISTSSVVIAYDRDCINQSDPRPTSCSLKNLKKRLKVQSPDILILTTEGEALRKSVVSLISPQTEFLDPFVLKIIRRLKQVSRELALARAKLQTVELMKQVLMSGPETSIMVVDEDLKILEINNAILARTKMSQEDCVGRLCHWIIRKEMKPCYAKGEKCGVREVLQKGRAVITVREEYRDDGSNKYFTINSYPLPAEESGKRKVMIVWRDVSKQMRPVLNRQARSIQKNFTYTLQEQKMAALGKLASAAAHEINNPVQGIVSFAKLMRQSFDKESLTKAEMERFRSYLDLISSESERCGKIVQGLLSFSRKKDLRKSEVDLMKTLEDIALLLGNRMKIQGISLHMEKSRTPAVVQCDGDQIKQALLNIILNSVEAMPTGGLITVSMDLVPDEKHLVIRIQDNGPGIPENVKNKIFEPFYTTKKDHQGTGLGLSVVYGIMWQHGATIEVQTAKGKGTTFTINLPVAGEPKGEYGAGF
jgi:signal transduction histidine kinase